MDLQRGDLIAGLDLSLRLRDCETAFEIQEIVQNLVETSQNTTDHLQIGNLFQAYNEILDVIGTYQINLCVLERLKEVEIRI